MREILFRGFDNNFNVWRYGSLISYIGGHCAIVANDDRYSGGILVNEVIPETVGQDTGLKDKNGKEIYEGDIIEKTYYSYHQPECSELFEIKYEGLSFHFEHIKGSTFHLPFTEDIEIIGNIHDNPELVVD
jgi:uncharacterized phage protein (TIGR01671 family)